MKLPTKKKVFQNHLILKISGHYCGSTYYMILSLSDVTSKKG